MASSNATPASRNFCTWPGSAPSSATNVYGKSKRAQARNARAKCTLYGLRRGPSLRKRLALADAYLSVGRHVRAPSSFQPFLLRR